MSLYSSTLSAISSVVASASGWSGKRLRHLFGRFQILLERIAHPIGIVQVAAGIEADQMIVRHGVFGQNEMHVVRADVFDSAFGRQLQQGLIDQ